jgi:hypothetical protein
LGGASGGATGEVFGFVLITQEDVESEGLHGGLSVSGLGVRGARRRH